MRINFLNKTADNNTRSESLLIQTPGLQQGKAPYQTLIVADDFFDGIRHRARFWGWESLHYDSSIAFICNAKIYQNFFFNLTLQITQQFWPS